MKRLAALLGLLAIAGCAEEEQAAVEVDVSKRLSPGCYTVDLFDPYTIHQPAPDVPEDARAFLGVWKNGAWGGHWCHDLYITEAFADGTVELLDAYGPYRDAGIEATVFKRRGRVEDGVLKFTSRDRSPVEYRIVGGYLVGERKGTLGTFEITMSREEGPEGATTRHARTLPGIVPAVAEAPLPPRKPLRS
jgi:hypothetical protein